MKDIFIDAQIANKFATCPDQSHKDLVDWLVTFDSVTPSNNAHLVVSNRLIWEYDQGNTNCRKPTCIMEVIRILKSTGNRVSKIENSAIEKFKTDHSRPMRKLKSNYWDKEFHLPTVLSSVRRMALIRDDKFAKDVVKFPGFDAIVANHPSELNYK